MGKLQQATGVIVKIANLSPIGFLATEAINAATYQIYILQVVILSQIR